LAAAVDAAVIVGRRWIASCLSACDREVLFLCLRGDVEGCAVPCFWVQDPPFLSQGVHPIALLSDVETILPRRGVQAPHIFLPQAVVLPLPHSAPHFLRYTVPLGHSTASTLVCHVV
ncbi:unnamed protein product, partial [Ectocarpus sp. 4 AP-2014]